MPAAHAARPASPARIAEVLVHRRPIPLVRPFVTAVRTATELDVMIVELRDGDGHSGWGEAPCSWRVTGESPQSVAAAVEGALAPAVVGLDADDPAAASLACERALTRNAAARMAVDCAAHDLAAGRAGVPLHRFLGGAGAPAVVRTDMTLSAVSSADGIPALARAAAEHAAQGFRTLKVKVGAGADDVAAVAAVRAAAGAEVVLRADANQGWSVGEAIRVIRGWEDAGLGVELVEQPVHRDDVEGLAAVTAAVGTPVLADESVCARRDLREVLRLRAAGLVNIKLAKTGGLREALALLELARANEVTALIGCMMEGHVGIAAAAALASVADAAQAPGALPGSVAHDLDTGLWLAASPVAGGVAYDGQLVRLSDAPGTGIAGLAAAR